MYTSVCAGCDISHENNKLVSGTHCYILRDEAGKVWLYDSRYSDVLHRNVCTRRMWRSDSQGIEKEWLSNRPECLYAHTFDSVV